MDSFRQIESAVFTFYHIRHSLTSDIRRSLITFHYRYFASELEIPVVGLGHGKLKLMLASFTRWEIGREAADFFFSLFWSGFQFTVRETSIYRSRNFNLPFEKLQFTAKHDLNLTSRISIYHEIQLSVPNFNLP